jgi:hypothetical protein
LTKVNQKAAVSKGLLFLQLSLQALEQDGNAGRVPLGERERVKHYILHSPPEPGFLAFPVNSLPKHFRFYCFE